MAIDISQFYEVFFDESEELLAEAERLLLGIDLENPDGEDLNAIFRAAHSIKGGAATFGMMDMTEITHVLENLLDKIRKNEMALTAEHVDAFLAAKDVLKMELDGHRLASAVDQDQVSDVKMVLKALSAAGDIVIKPVKVIAQVLPVETVAPPEVVAAPVTAPLAASMFCFHIALPDMVEKDVNNLQEELELLGDVVSTKKTDGRFLFALTTDSTAADISSICSFVLDPDDLIITLAPRAAAALPVAAVAKVQAVGIINLAPSSNKVQNHEEVGYGLFTDAGKDDIEAGYGFFAPFQSHADAVKATLIGDDTVVAAVVMAAAEHEDHADKKPAARRETEKVPATLETSSIRVGIEKVDQLINLVGELVITQAMIEQRISMLDPVEHEPLLNSVSQLIRNTRDLQESVMSIRMMPMDFVFSRFPRMVRDLAAKLNKKVEFVTVGAATELDKGLIERIVDPLTHLVRNSVDHGLETPANRKAAGKSETGVLTLSATHKGGSIVIEVTDDGAGLNRNQLLEKAHKSGRSVSEKMTDAEVFALIFAPGFSTAEVVTDVSGRGVGMDVVKRNISAMGGVVEIRSALGFGTTISIALPLTLAILDGMTVALGSSIYVIPLNLIVETLQPRLEDIKTVTGEGRMVHVRGEYLPIIALHRLFNQHTDITDPTQGVLVLLEADGKKSALFVDRLVGQQQVVIKSLETNYRKVMGISGATIMGDGCVALILDVSALIQMGQNTNYLSGALPFAQHGAALSQTQSKDLSS